VALVRFEEKVAIQRWGSKLYLTFGRQRDTIWMFLNKGYTPGKNLWVALAMV